MNHHPLLLPRRDFIRRSALLVSGGSGLLASAPLGRALGLWLQDRPPLTEESLNGYLTAARAKGIRAVNGVVTEVRADARLFFRNRFALSGVQEAFLAKLKPADLGNLSTAFERGLAGQNELVIRIPRPAPGNAECLLNVARADMRRGPGGMIESWAVTVVRQ